MRVFGLRCGSVCRPEINLLIQSLSVTNQSNRPMTTNKKSVLTNYNAIFLNKVPVIKTQSTKQLQALK